MLHCAGEAIQDIFKTISDNSNENKTLKQALQDLASYFEPRKNITFERHSFLQEEQKSDSCENFTMKLRTQAKRCDFGDKLEDMIKDQFMEKCKPQNLRTRLLRDTPEKLKQLISVARAHEEADRQANMMKEERVSYVSKHIIIQNQAEIQHSDQQMVPKLNLV